MCKIHHNEIDKNPQVYTTECLQAMKHTHETKVRPLVMHTSRELDISLFSLPGFPIDIINKRVEDETSELHEQSFYTEFDGIAQATHLCQQLKTGDFSIASLNVRSESIATLATVLERRKQHEQATDAIAYAESLAMTQTAFLARARITGTKSTRSQLLQQLNAIATPMARTVALLLTARLDGSGAALDWYDKSDLRVDMFDPEGQFILCTMMLQNSSWDRAVDTAMAMPTESFNSIPALHHVVAMIYLATTVPTEHRQALINTIPFNARDYPISDKPTALEHRRTAVSHFYAAAKAAATYGLPATKANEERYAIWLELLDPETETRESARKRLRKRLNTAGSALPFMQLGIEFEELQDLDEVKRELETHCALNGGETADSIAASLSILMKNGSPAKLAKFIEEKHDELVKYIDASSLTKTRIYAHAFAGDSQHANELLANAPKVLSTNDRDAIVALIESQCDDGEFQILMRKYESDGRRLSDLKTLVAYLEEAKQWQEICRYGRELFDNTHREQDATLLAYSYYQTNQPQLLCELVHQNTSLLSLSAHLRLLYGWALHGVGDFQEARRQLRNVPSEIDHRGYRLLRANLDISTGNWEDLHTYVRKELQHIETSSADDLVSSAKLASDIRSNRAMELIRAAAQKGWDRPEVLATCNALAVRLAQEDDADVSSWLPEAVRLSSPDGPIKMMSLDEFAGYRQLQSKTEMHIWELLVAAEIPIFLAAYHLGCGVSDYTLIRAMRNATTDDNRDKLPIPAYSSRNMARVPDDVQIIGIDATAILSLAYLGILGTTIDSFKKTIISCSMFEWLFHEYTQSTLHQPCRLIEARQLLDLVNSNDIRQISDQNRSSSALHHRVGNDLATLLHKADSSPSDRGVRHIVVHPRPSMLDSSDDGLIESLEGYGSLLTSCSAVIDWLEERAFVTKREVSVARAFLVINEEQCPDPVEITMGSHLYLSRLAIRYLHRLRLLGKLTHSGVVVNVPKDSIDEARAVQSLARDRDAASDEITSIRNVLVASIDKGKVAFARRTRLAESEADRLAQHPNVDLVAISEECDVIVCDDRVCNKYPTVEKSSRRIPILSTLDLIDILMRRGHIDGVHRDSLRTKLRDAGFVLIPVDEDEIVRFLQGSRVVNGQVNETAELKAIRNNLQMIRLHGWFHAPVDQGWMDTVFVAIARAMPKLWGSGISREEAIAYSYWLRQQFNVRHYGHFFQGDEAFAEMRRYEVNFISEILISAQGLPLEHLVDFLDWFDEAMIKPLRWIDQESHDTVLQRQMAWVSESANRAIEHRLGQPTLETVSASDVVYIMLGRVPPSFRDAIATDSEFIAEYQLEDISIVSFNQPAITVYRRSLLDSLGLLFSELAPVSVETPDGRECVVRFDQQDPPIPILSQDDHNILLENFLVFSPDSTARIRSFTARADYYEVPPPDRIRWEELLRGRIPSPQEFDAITRDLRDSPAGCELLIAQALEAGNLVIDLIVPASQRYYSRLIGCYDMSATIDRFVQGTLGVLLDTRVAAVDKWGVHRCLLTGIDPRIIERIPLTEDVANATLKALEEIVSSSDVVSQTSAVELVLLFLDTVPSIGRFVGTLIDSIISDDPESPSSRFAMFYHLFVIIDSRLIQTRVLADCPPFYRRAVALAQAALVQSVMLRHSVESDALAELARSPQSIYNRVQSLADMRRDPLWHPGFASPDYFMSNSCARIGRALLRTQQRLGQSRFVELVGTHVAAMCNDDRVTSLEIRPSPLGGPILGLVGSESDIRSSIRLSLDASECSLSEFHKVATYLRFLSVERDVVKHFERLLVDFEIAIKNDPISEGRPSWLSLLAGVAATTKSRVVTDFVHSLLLQSLAGEDCTVDVGTICDIGIVACSSSPSAVEWRDDIGAWFQALTDLNLDPSKARVLALILETLCFLFPELWISCGRSYAALRNVRR